MQRMLHNYKLHNETKQLVEDARKNPEGEKTAKILLFCVYASCAQQCKHARP